MKVYTSEQEQAIRARRSAEEWMRSGLIDAAQRARIAADLQVDLRRTNRFLRLTLFAFGVLIVGAGAGLVGVTLELRSETSAGVLCVFAAAACIVATELLIGRFRIYHFGIEEAFAVTAVVFLAAGSALFVSGSPGDRPLLIALIVGSMASLAVYRRYGYVYAAAGAMACLALAPTQAELPPFMQRLVAAAALGACAIVARAAHRRHGDEYPGDDYAALEALAWLGLYASLNLQIVPWFYALSLPSWFYWSTYAMIWALPAAALWLSIRHKDRLLLDAGIVMALATILTNKPYLGAVRKPWDPIVFGVLLIAIGLAVRRWLAGGHGASRHGFTASRLLRSDTDALTSAALASAAFHPAHDQPPVATPPSDLFEGGRSGGGGGGASY
jgi:hypothetical protein